MNSKLTVVVPLFNQEKYIRQCMESILNQSITDLLLIVINDGSTDKSLEICNEIAKKDERVTVISQKNKGLAGARLAGLKNTKTKYVTFVDADDFILPDAYESAFPYMEDDIDEIFYEISRYYNKHEIKREYHVISPGIYNKKRITDEVYPKLIWNFERKTPGIDCSQCVRIVKTQLLRDEYQKLQSNKFYYGEDIAITYPLMTHIQSMAVITESYYMHRQREPNEVPNYISNRGYFGEVSNLFKYLRNELKKNEEDYNFDAQLDYYYMYSVELKKKCYGDYSYSRDFLFPFDKVPYGKKIVLYGAGAVGKAYYNQIFKLNYCTEIIWIDRNAKYISDFRVNGLDILDDNRIQDIPYFVIAVENRDVCEQIKMDFLSKGVEKYKIIY